MDMVGADARELFPAQAEGELEADPICELGGLIRDGDQVVEHLESDGPLLAVLAVRVLGLVCGQEAARLRELSRVGLYAMQLVVVLDGGEVGTGCTGSEVRFRVLQETGEALDRGVQAGPYLSDEVAIFVTRLMYWSWKT